MDDKFHKNKELTKYRFMVENARQEFYLVHPNGNLEFVNNAVCENLEYSKDELQKSSVSLFDNDFGNKFYQHFQDLKAKKYLSGFETIHKTKSGVKRIKRMSSFYLNIEGDEYICGIAEDVTEQKTYQKALAESEEKFRIMAENSFDVMWKLDQNYCFTYISPSGKRTHLYEANDLIGQSIWSLLKPEGIEEVKKVNAKRLADEKKGIVTSAVTYELEQRRKDGTYFWTEVHVVPYRDRKGKLIGYHGLTRDIHQRKMAEIALQESERSMDTLLNNLPGVAYRCKYDKKYSMTYLSNGCKNLTGYSPEDFKNNKLLSFSDIIFDEDQNEIWYIVSNCVTNKKPYEVTYRITTKCGSIKWVMDRGVALYGNDNKIECLEGFITDITEKKLTEEELIIAKKRAEQSDKLKSAFLANVSHEIRTPMNGLLGFTELLNDTELTSKDQVEYIDMIKRSGERMLNILNDIIDISKIEAGLTEVHIDSFNLYEQIKYMKNFFMPEAKIKNLEIINANKTDKKLHSLEINTDKEKLLAILTNLIKNAIKYTNQGHIKIKFEEDETKDYIKFCISDTGVGIAKDMQDTVFNRFVRCNNVNSVNNDGSGLGLAISKAYVEMLQGEIWLESEENKGSSFYFRIPKNHKN